MRAIKSAFFLLFICIFSLSGQTSQKTGRVKVFYDSQIENYAFALSKILNIGVNESIKRNFKTPKEIELKIIHSDRAASYDNSRKMITLEYDTLSRFMPPSCAFLICGELDKLGSLVFMNSLGIRDLKKLHWMNRDFRACWSIYFASNLIDAIYEISSDTIWPTAYNFKKHGTENLMKISTNEKSPIHNGINAWIDLGNCISFDKFPDFFDFFNKNGLTKDAFIKSLYKFLDAEVAKQWEEKYMQHIAL